MSKKMSVTFSCYLIGAKLPTYVEETIHLETSDLIVDALFKENGFEKIVSSYFGCPVINLKVIKTE